MKQEDKELLLKDLSSRLLYNCRVFYEYIDNLDNKTYGYSLTLNTWCIDEFIANKAVIKPYLRPMSSMTEEERKEYELLANHCIVTSIGFIHLEAAPLIDWLNTHHFDFRNLIERGLAIDCTDLNVY